MKILLIIPAYNEERNIVRTVQSVEAIRSEKRNRGYILDYIVINDGSLDNTGEICRDNNIKCINLIQNLGIGGAVQTGYIYACIANYDIAIQFDGDGQHDINSLDKLIAPIIEGKADFVVGSRFVKPRKLDDNFQSTFMRRVGIRYLSFLLNLFAGIKVKDVTSGYRAANRHVLEMFANDYPVDYPEPESLVMLAKNSVRISEVGVNMFERAEGKSSIRAWKSVYYMIKVSLAIVCRAFQKSNNKK